MALSARLASRFKALGLAPLLVIALALPPTTAPESGAEEGANAGAQRLQGAVVVIIDTARADHLSPYGHKRDTSPGLRDLAARGVLFEQTVSYAPWTLRDGAHP